MVNLFEGKPNYEKNIYFKLILKENGLGSFAANLKHLFM